jgi:hypothetical protein
MGTTIFKAEAWTIVNNEDHYDLDSMKYGIRDGGYDKNVLFNRKFIQEMNYAPGCHSSAPVGNVKFSSKPYILHHYRDIHIDRTISRGKATLARLSDNNKRNGWGVWQVSRSEAEFRAGFEMLGKLKIEVPTRRSFKKEK